VPTSTVARILGKAGASINAIKDESGAQIDIDKTSDDKTTVTVKGDKKAIAAAKASILAIVSDFGDQTTDTVTIENKYVGHSCDRHRPSADAD
jgi:polyribonucleotide nucleotidyltransferase